MARRPIFAPHVPSDLVAAIDYYERIAPALANDFRYKVNDKLDDSGTRCEALAAAAQP